MAKIQRGDWVLAIADTRGSVPGIVRRVAADGTWADVDWRMWTKRMQTKHLIVQHTIQRGEWAITDETRKRELEEEQH